MWLRCSSARSWLRSAQQSLRIACRARISIQLIFASDVQVPCSLQDKPLTVDAELDTRLALWSARELMVYEDQASTAVWNVSYYQTSMEMAMKRQEKAWCWIAEMPV